LALLVFSGKKLEAKGADLGGRGVAVLLKIICSNSTRLL